MPDTEQNTNPATVSISLPNNWKTFVDTQYTNFLQNIPQPAYGTSPALQLAEELMPASKTLKQPKTKEKFYNIPIYEYWCGRESPLEGDIGLEIECEGQNLFNAPISYWCVKEDHSLRAHGQHPPAEYVLKKPIKIDEVEKALSYLNTKLKEVKSKLDDSTRTSVHVHVNVQDMNFKQLVSYIGLWTIFEEPLTEWCGKDRIGNLFCLRNRDAEANIQWLAEYLKTSGASSNNPFHDAYRYSGCNLNSVSKFGSLEFRTLRGTVDKETILTWVDLLWFLKQSAKKYENPQELVEQFIKLGPFNFTDTVTKECPRLHHIISSYSELHRSLWDGLRLWRDVAYAVREWEPANPNYKPEPKIKVLKLKTVLDHSTSNWSARRWGYLINTYVLRLNNNNAESPNHLNLHCRPSGVSVPIGWCAWEKTVEGTVHVCLTNAEHSEAWTCCPQAGTLFENGWEYQ